MGKREQPAFRCDLHVLKDVNLEVAEGEKLVIIGPSGSGKSTTVRCINFLEEPTSGHVYIDGQELTAKNKTKLVRETTSMVFQQFNLYPHMTVLKNLTLAPMKLHHKKKQVCLFKQTFWGGTGKSSCGTSSCRAVLWRLVLCPPAGGCGQKKKRRPVQVGHRFSRPLRDRQGK